MQRTNVPERFGQTLLKFTAKLFDQTLLKFDVVQIHAGTKKNKNGETQCFFGKAFFSKERF